MSWRLPTWPPGHMSAGSEPVPRPFRPAETTQPPGGTPRTHMIPLGHSPQAQSASRSAETDAVALWSCVAGATSMCPAYTVSRCRRTDEVRKRDGCA